MQNDPIESEYKAYLLSMEYQDNSVIRLTTPQCRYIADKWGKALRSNRYEQCRSRLRDSSSVPKYRDAGGLAYCAQGVLCDVIDPERWEAIHDGVNQCWSGQTMTPPQWVKANIVRPIETAFQDDFGIKQIKQTYQYRHVHIWHLNDRLYWNFQAIASLILNHIDKAWPVQENAE